MSGTCTPGSQWCALWGASPGHEIPEFPCFWVKSQLDVAQLEPKIWWLKPDFCGWDASCCIHSQSFRFFLINPWFLLMTSPKCALLKNQQKPKKFCCLNGPGFFTHPKSFPNLFVLSDAGVKGAGNLLWGDIQRWKAAGQGPGNCWSGPGDRSGVERKLADFEDWK